MLTYKSGKTTEYSAGGVVGLMFCSPGGVSPFTLQDQREGAWLQFVCEMNTFNHLPEKFSCIVALNYPGHPLFCPVLELYQSNPQPLVSALGFLMHFGGLF